MKILLSGGGTAGHINPALAIAKYAISQDPDTEVLFIGTKKGLESTLVPKEGFDIKFVDVEGLQKKISFESFVSASKLGVATIKMVAIMRKFKPDVVVGTGGYVCVPAILAAKILKIPSVVHEQNVFPGSAVKFLADKCNATLISFDESRRYFKDTTKMYLTGNPIRPDILKHSTQKAKMQLGLGESKLILVFGGSLGATKINNVIIDFVERNGEIDDTVIYIGTGKRDYKRVMQEIEKRNINLGKSIKILEYIDNMDLCMNAADVVVCRSGAITLAELSALGKPAVLIPSPNVTNNHQEYNARALSDNGAAITILEKDFDAKSLEDAVFKIICDESFAKAMSEKSKAIGITDACEKIYNIMKELV